MKKDHENVIERLAPVFERVDQQLRDHLASDVPYIGKVCQYILLSGGKRLRPVLFVLAARLCGYSGDREYYFSSVFEYLHAASLLHDDVVDQSDTRRGRTAAHLVYGNKGVILVGDFLFAKSLALAAETGSVRFLEVLANTVALMSEGEVLQLLHARDPGTTEEAYERVIHRKTGALIESACYLGAVLAGSGDGRAEGLRLYGRKIGQAFQIVDDALDYSTTQDELGKPVGHDLDEGKITLPVIRALAQAEPEDGKEIRALVTKKERTAEEFQRVKALIDKYQGLEQTMTQAARLAAEAKETLADFPDRQEKTDLLDLAEFIVARRK